MQSTVKPILKALGDETRYGIYAWLRDQPSPVTIVEVAGQFGLHPNTVRPHLERLREVGLVELDSTPQGSVGRPQHRYVAVPAEIELHRQDRPEDGYALLARMLADVCVDLPGYHAEAVTVGRAVGAEVAASTSAVQVVDALDLEMDRLGFGPSTEDGCVVFTSCPFRALAEDHPGIVCALHEGLVTGVVEAFGGMVEEFHDLESPGPCLAMFRDGSDVSVEERIETGYGAGTLKSL